MKNVYIQALKRTLLDILVHVIIIGTPLAITVIGLLWENFFIAVTPLSVAVIVWIYSILGDMYLNNLQKEKSKRGES